MEEKWAKKRNPENFNSEQDYEFLFTDGPICQFVTEQLKEDYPPKTAPSSRISELVS